MCRDLEPDRIRLGILIQARMTSRRLPGKVLARLGDRPVLGHLLDRMEDVSGADLKAVVTSLDPSDDAVAAWCQERGVLCRRGSLEDVAGRFLEAARHWTLDAFVRVCGDSPLLDPELVTRAMTLYRSRRPDLVTNVLVRTYPRGQSVEVLCRHRFEEACAGMADPEEREHVTQHLYRDPSHHDIVSMESGRSLGELRHVLDTPEDLERLRRLLTRMDRPARTYSLDDILRLEGVNA